MEAEEGTVVYFGTTSKNSGHNAIVLSGSFKNSNEEDDFACWCDGLHKRKDLAKFWPTRKSFATINFDCGTWFGVNLSPHDERLESKTVLYVHGLRLSEQQMLRILKKYPRVQELFSEVCAKYKINMPREELSGAELIANERQRQMDVEGYDAVHDKEHSFVELARAAITYLELAIFASDLSLRGDERAIDKLHMMGMKSWPWEGENLKPSLDSKRNLAKAGALAAAAIDRIIMEE